jgi:FMN phosphatase YigB (HAD superfamily)
MKQFFTTAFLLACVTYATSHGMETAVITPKVIIWDVGGVLTKSPSVWYHIKNLSASQFASTLAYMWEKSTMGIKTQARKRFFEMLEAVYEQVVEESKQYPHLKKFIYPEEKERTRTVDNVFMPHLLCGYQTGQFTAEDIRDLLESKIDSLRYTFFSSEHEEALLQSSISAAFTPERYAPSETPRKEVVELLRAVASQTDATGNKRFINAALSNWDTESFGILKQLHAELFSHFDHFFVSGEQGVLKPQEAAFRNVLTKLNVSAHECLFIDDQKENVEAAEKYGFRSHLFTDAEHLRTFLKDQDLELPEDSQND